jgi:hypothetical protein
MYTGENLPVRDKESQDIKKRLVEQSLELGFQSRKQKFLTRQAKN